MSQELLRTALERALAEMGVPDQELRFERPRDPTHGDLATNVALTLAGRLGRPPRVIAQELIERIDLPADTIESVEIAGPGFLNFRFGSAELAQELKEILDGDKQFGRATTGKGERVMVEFVSANPTGPLHLGHGRQAALGDAIASLLEWNGWKVQREFYYNDAGLQMDRLAHSVWARYHQVLGRPEPVREDGYHGQYVMDIAQAFHKQVGDLYEGIASSEALNAMRRFAVEVIRKEQDEDLQEFGVLFDEYYLESSLYTDGRVKETIRRLRDTGLVYEEGGAVWLKTTEFGDQKDRVMVKSDGSPTYFLPDVAYHLAKWERGFKHAINVQGSDHHGTVARVHAGLQALGLPAGYPEYVLHQMVTVEREGEEVKLSKRAGSYTTLRALIDEVGADVTRYFFQMRKPDAHLVFDLDTALDRSEKNPLFKVQYAHARMCSVFAKAEVDPQTVTGEAVDLGRLKAQSERELVRQLGEFPEVVARAAEQRAPHVLCDYLEKTAGAVNSWYHSGNPSRNPELAVLVDDPALRGARLALTRAVQVVLRNGLWILGLSAPERMEREDAESGPS
ncbi:MAG: arginine--tRNA ligase [Gemmatimonadota bacterium]